jgi:hypothetical protein
MTERIGESTEEFDNNAFQRFFPVDKFNKGIEWTAQGSPEELNQIAHARLEACLRGNPEMGVIQFRRLPDGGYEISSYQSNK